MNIDSIFGNDQLWKRRIERLARLNESVDLMSDVHDHIAAQNEDLAYRLDGLAAEAAQLCKADALGTGFQLSAIGVNGLKQRFGTWFTALEQLDCPLLRAEVMAILDDPADDERSAAVTLPGPAPK